MIFTFFATAPAAEAAGTATALKPCEQAAGYCTGCFSCRSPKGMISHPFSQYLLRLKPPVQQQPRHRLHGPGLLLSSWAGINPTPYFA